MKELRIYEFVKCDLCGNEMSEETNGAVLKDMNLQNGTYIKGMVRVSAFVLNRKVTCICNNCMKEILERFL